MISLRSKRNLVLIGMPGCGKSTIGKALSEKLGMNFCDVDEYIVKKKRMSINEIFKMGEGYFRDIESKAVEEISNLDNVVIATGGGVVTRETNINKLKENGNIIFINRPINKIMECLEVNSRPLLKDNKNHLKTIYENRINLYKSFSDIEIINDGTAEEFITNLLTIIERSCI